MLIPSLLLKKLYTLGSLKNTPAGVEFAIKNRLSDAELVGLVRIAVDGRDVPLSGLRLTMEDGRVLTPGQITPAQPLGFPLRAVVSSAGGHSGAGRRQTCAGHHLRVAAVRQAPVLGGRCHLRGVRGVRAYPARARRRLRAGDHRGTAGVRRADHRRQAATHPALLLRPARGEGQLRKLRWGRPGAAGTRGPFRVNGEHAQGDYLIPLATAEGTLVASYNRGMKVLNLCGGVKCTVVDDAMQRAPVFVFEDARGAATSSSG